MASYVLMRFGSYLASKVGWGPTTTKELDQAEKFDSFSSAYEYRRNHDFFEKYDIGRINNCGHVEPVASR